ncbi:MAG: hypothetical protein FWD73_08020 [Polyangiaceae bacterium]|nr:hypothetical protein [Polyangiaceae bacterium]
MEAFSMPISANTAAAFVKMQRCFSSKSAARVLAILFAVQSAAGRAYSDQRSYIRRLDGLKAVYTASI